MDDKMNIIEEVKTWKKQHQEMMLGRLVSDCQQWFEYDNKVRLWGITVDKHIEYMKIIYGMLENKPKWLTMEQIEKYENKMLNMLDK